MTRKRSYPVAEIAGLAPSKLIMESTIDPQFVLHGLSCSDSIFCIRLSVVNRAA